MSQTFGQIRQKALSQWIAGSGRERINNLEGDNFSNAIECQWQAYADEQEKHVNLFCGLGDWSTQITDLLTDDRFDSILLPSEDGAVILEEHQRALFRVFQRLLTIVEQIISDLQDLLKETGIATNQFSQRTIMSNAELLGFDVASLMRFVNHVAKHKGKKLHAQDDHLPIHFQDCYETTIDTSVDIAIGCLTPPNPQWIVIPKLDVLIECVLIAYQNVNNAIKPILNEYCEQIGVSENVT